MTATAELLNKNYIPYVFSIGHTGYGLLVILCMANWKKFESSVESTFFFPKRHPHFKIQVFFIRICSSTWCCITINNLSIGLQSKLFIFLGSQEAAINFKQQQPNCTSRIYWKFYQGWQHFPVPACLLPYWMQAEAFERLPWRIGPHRAHICWGVSFLLLYHQGVRNKLISCWPFCAGIANSGAPINQSSVSGCFRLKI